MDFTLTPDQQRLRDTARHIAETVIAPRAAEVDRTEAYRWDNVAWPFDCLTITPRMGRQRRGLRLTVVQASLGPCCGAF